MTEQPDAELPLFRQPSSSDLSFPKKPTKPPASSNFGKYIVYVDESGDHAMQKIDEKYPVFVLAFCIFHKTHYSESVVPALEKFKFKHFGHDEVVLHENEIRKEKGAFRIFPSREHKTAFLDELTSIISDNNFILISCVIRKEGLKERQELPQHPYHTALRFCAKLLEKNRFY